MTWYIKKPVRIEAVQYTGDNFADVAQFCGFHRDSGNEIDIQSFNRIGTYMLAVDPELVAEVWDKLHSSWIGVKLNQYIIRGIKGEFYPCDEDVFDESYRFDANTGSDYIDIGPECFSIADKSVISWVGENYYRACGHPVVVNPDGSGSTCVKRVEHPGKLHEDYAGDTYHEALGSNPEHLEIPRPTLWPDEELITREMLEQAWAEYIKPLQEAGEEQTQTQKVIMNLLRTVNMGLPR